MDTRKGKEVHDLVSFVGLRAHATAVGLIQLSVELARAGVIQEDAITRIKEAIFDDLALGRPGSLSKEEFERSTRLRLDRLFAGEEKLGPGEVAAPGS
ncbi:MAG: hypothetical protein WC729_26480 [Sphingomonas sp.]|jgi:hypothetical protein|uniref:hypothetical protein n=1 Tax=Sphingomonas sp. TaxID=28214 RepID=UPI00356AF6C8